MNLDIKKQITEACRRGVSNLVQQREDETHKVSKWVESKLKELPGKIERAISEGKSEITVAFIDHIEFAVEQNSTKRHVEELQSALYKNGITSWVRSGQDFTKVLMSVNASWVAQTSKSS